MVLLKITNIYFDTENASFDVSDLPTEAEFKFEVKDTSLRTIDALICKAINELTERTHGLLILDMSVDFEITN